MYCLKELPSHTVHGFVIFETVENTERGSYLGLLNTDLTVVEQLAVQEVCGGEIVLSDILSDALVGRWTLWWLDATALISTSSTCSDVPLAQYYDINWTLCLRHSAHPGNSLPHRLFRDLQGWQG